MRVNPSEEHIVVDVPEMGSPKRRFMDVENEDMRLLADVLPSPAELKWLQSLVIKFSPI